MSVRSTASASSSIDISALFDAMRLTRLLVRIRIKASGYTNQRSTLSGAEKNNDIRTAFACVKTLGMISPKSKSMKVITTVLKMKSPMPVNMNMLSTI